MAEQLGRGLKYVVVVVMVDSRSVSAKGKVGKSEEGENGVLVRHWGWVPFLPLGGEVGRSSSFQQSVAIVL